MKREAEPDKKIMEEESVMELGSIFLLDLSNPPEVRGKELFVFWKPPRDHICLDIFSSGRVEDHLIQPEIYIQVGSKET